MIALASGHIKPMIGPGGPEQSVTSAVRSLVDQRLRESGYRTTMIPSRYPRAERVALAKKVGATVYVSVECTVDSRPGWTHADGITIEAPRASDMIARELTQTFGELVPIRIREIKTRDDTFLAKRLPCHFVTVTLGFLSNHADVDVLTSQDGQRRIATAIAAGVFPWAS